MPLEATVNQCSEKKENFYWGLHLEGARLTLLGMPGRL